VSSRHRPLATVTRERLIESHLPLAKSVARRYAGRGVDLDDLVQVGAVGLIKAADRFDASRGVAFSTFAEPTIEGEIRHHLRDRSAPVRIPRELQRLGKRLRGRQGELGAKLGRAPTLSELADAVQADVSDVERALAAEHAREPVELHGAEAAAGTAVDAEPFASMDARLLIAERMHVLDERERQIVYLRFHADLTERQIARQLEISQAHVSRLLAGALAKLQSELADDESPANGADTTVVPPRIKAAAGAGAGSGGGEDAPGPGKPKPGTAYSGRFLVRMPSDLHEQLVQAAAREHVSLNRFVTGVLAESVTGEARTEVDPAPAVTPPPATTEAEAPQGRSRNPARSLRMAVAANVLIVVLAAAVAVVLLIIALQRGI
jgi:RNA polymerase sigma-B factor